MSNPLNSSSLFDFSSVPDFLRSTSDPKDNHNNPLAIPSIHSSNSDSSNSNNSLEHDIYRGLRSASTLTTHFDHNNALNSTPSTNNFYWPTQKAADNHITENTHKTDKVSSLTNSFQTFVVSAPLPLKPEPVYIERYTSFTSSANIDEITQALSVSLSSALVDFSFNQEKHKFQCVFYDCFNNAVQFIVRLYLSSSNKNNEESIKVVEFQRRQGCCIAYNRVYQMIYNNVNINKSPYISKCSSPNSLLSNDSPFHFRKPVFECLKENSCLITLLNMAKSQEIVCARESLRALSCSDLKLSVDKNKDIAEAILCTIVNVYNKPIKDDEQERLASIILNQLSEIDCCRDAIVSKLFTSVLSCLDAPITKSSLSTSTGMLQCRDTKRYLAACLDNCAQSTSSAKTIKSLCNDNSEYLSILRKYEHVVDSRVSVPVQQTLAAINVA